MKLSTNEKFRLKSNYGPWAVVTGASSGIGLEIAEQLAGAGLNVVLHGRTADRLMAVATTIKSTFGVDVISVVSDLSEPGGTAKIIEATTSVPLGLAVMSAGFGTSGLFVKSTAAEELSMLRVNCESLLLLTHHYSRQFVSQKRGGIIMMSSLVAFQGVPYSAHYAATKAYVQSLAEGLAEELRGEGVDVLAAAPGPVVSGFGPRANLRMAKTLKPSEVGIPILRALGRSSTVLPGGMTKFLIYSLRTLPRWGKVKVMSLVMGGMTKHQRE